MLTTVQNPPSTTSDPVADVPLDWPGLWLHMLRARDGAPQPQLVHSPEHGWAIDGPIGARASALFDLYKPVLDARTRQRGPRGQNPWVVAQLGQSLDGFVATLTGDSYYVNGAHCLLHLHRLRALCDAVLVGAGTVATDNPQLTTRRVPGPQPVRVVMDPAARLDGLSRVFRAATQRRPARAWGPHLCAPRCWRWTTCSPPTQPRVTTRSGRWLPWPHAVCTCCLWRAVASPSRVFSPPVRWTDCTSWWRRF